MFGFFKKKKAPEQVSEVPYILAIADCISHNNSTVHDSLERCRNDRAAYAAQFAERFAERGIDAASCDMDTLCWIAMADELEAAHALIGVDSSSELEDFLWAVSQLNGGEKLDFSGLDLSEDADVFQWCAVCNAYLRQQDMLLCGVDIDSDDLQLILVTAAEYDKISALAEQAGHRIAPAETL